MAIAITNVTHLISPNGESPIMFGDSGLIQEVFELVDSGGTTANTSLTAIAPRYIKDIRHINSTLMVSDNLNLATTNATVTLKTKVATLDTEEYRVTLIGRR